MNSIVVRTSEDFRRLQEDWERIESVAPCVTYFSTFRYNFEWWKQYEKETSIDLFIIVVVHNQDIVGIAPMQISHIKKFGYKYSELQFLHGGGDYSNFLISPNVQAKQASVISEILSQISIYQSEYDRINLSHISQHTLLAHEILISKNNTYLKYLIECPFISFSLFPDFDSFTKAFLPKKIRQYVNRFQREVDYSMKVSNENLVDSFARIHIAEKDYLRGKGFSYRHSFFEDKKELAFRNTLYNNNNNVLTYMLIDNTSKDIICYYTGYVFRGVFHSVTTAYQPKYAGFAIGKIFNYMIFEENFKNRRWDIFDMGTGRYSWKFEMTDCFNLLYQYQYNCFRKRKVKFLYKLRMAFAVFYSIIRS